MTWAPRRVYCALLQNNTPPVPTAGHQMLLRTRRLLAARSNAKAVEKTESNA